MSSIRNQFVALLRTWTRRSNSSLQPRVRLNLLTLETRDVPATLTVNTLADDTTADGFLTLREAITLVNAAGDANAAFGRSLMSGESAQIDTSTDAFGTNDTITFDSAVFTTGATIDLGSVLPDLSANVSIQGLGTDNVTIDGNQSGTILTIAGSVAASVAGLTMTGGNSATSGGGIANFGTLTVANSTLSGNIATEYGGGIANFGTLTVTNCTLSGNSATSGGGIASFGGLTVANSTLSGNIATEYGGGIYGGSTTLLKNTIVAGNTATTGADITASVDTANSFNNLIGTGGSGGLSDGVNGNQVGVADAMLGVLADTSEPRHTLALLAGSPAIDAGTSLATLTADATDSDTGLTVSSSTFLVAGQLYRIGTEIVQVQTIDSPTSVTVRRHQQGSNATVLTSGNAILLATDQRGALRRGVTDIGAFEFTTPPAPTPAILPAGEVGVSYAQTISANGGAGTVSLSYTVTGALPPGISVSQAVAGGPITVSGTPAIAGSATITVVTTDEFGTLTSHYNLIINSQLSLPKTALPAGEVGHAYLQTLFASGGTGSVTYNYTFTGTLPPGLAVSSFGRQFTVGGTPTASGTVVINVSATDQLGVIASGSYTLSINPELSISPLMLPGGMVLQPYSQTFAPVGGAGAITLTASVSGGALPTGLSITPSGGMLLLSGTPTASGTVTVTITASDTVGASAAMTYTLAIQPSPFVSVTLGPTGSYVLTADSSGALRQDSNPAPLTTGIRSASIAFEPTGNVILVVYESGALARLDSTGLHQLTGSGIQSASVAYGPQGEVMLITTTDGSLYRFDANGLQLLFGGGVLNASIAFEPIGEVLVITTTTGGLYRIDASGIHPLATSGVYSASIAYGPGGEVFVAILMDGSLIQIDGTGYRRLGTVA